MVKAVSTFNKKTVRDIPVNKKRILLRADFNVPINETGEIDSDFRIKSSIATIKYLIKQNAEVIILAHLGRPEGKFVKELSLEKVCTRLSELLGAEVEFISDCVGDLVKQRLKDNRFSHVSLLENVRFHPEEELNSIVFSKALIDSVSPDYVVQDGFGVVHRAHSSTEGISHLKPAVAGLLLEKEVTILTKAISHPQKPLVAIIGGAKISDKLPLIERFLEKADTVLVGGALANTFLSCQGLSIGKSFCEFDQNAEVQKILEKAAPGQVILPVDVAVAKDITEHAQRHECKLEHVHGDEHILDIGSVTAELFMHYIEQAGTVIWNGTLGYAENARFSKGSALIAHAMSDQYPSLESIVGGGDTADFVLDWQLHNKKAHFSHISTGGGASLELLSGERLPGVEALMDA